MNKNEMVNTKTTIEKIKDDGNVIIAPLIFDSDFKDMKKTPILANVNYLMMGDANLETVYSTCNGKLYDFDNEGFGKRSLLDLYNDQKTILNDIVLEAVIESTILSFRNFCVYLQKNTKTGKEFNPNIISDQLSIELSKDSVKRPLKDMISSKLFYIAKMREGKGDIAFYLKELEKYFELCAVNVSQYIGTAITHVFFDYIYYLTYTCSEDKDNCYCYCSAMQAELQPYIYKFIQTCINPAVFDLLMGAVDTLFFTYNDLYRFEKPDDPNLVMIDS